MKKYKSLITSSLLAALIIATPVVSFAENNNGNKDDNGNKKEQPLKVKKDGWFNSHNSKSVTAPVISSVVITSTKTKKATIKWNTDVRSNSFVWYSTTPTVDTSINPNMRRGDRVLKHKFELKKLQPNTKYYVIVGSANNIGIIKSSEISFTTPAKKVVIDTPVVIDTTAPIISDIENRINASNVTISWTTNELATSKTYYSPTTPVIINASNTLLITDNSLTKKHSVSIPSLTSNTLYHFILKSVDAANNTVSSNELSFRTN